MPIISLLVLFAGETRQAFVLPPVELSRVGERQVLLIDNICPTRSTRRARRRGSGHAGSAPTAAPLAAGSDASRSGEPLELAWPELELRKNAASGHHPLVLVLQPSLRLSSRFCASSALLTACYVSCSFPSRAGRAKRIPHLGASATTGGHAARVHWSGRCHSTGWTSCEPQLQPLSAVDEANDGPLRPNSVAAYLMQMQANRAAKVIATAPHDDGMMDCAAGGRAHTSAWHFVRSGGAQRRPHPVHHRCTGGGCQRHHALVRFLWSRAAQQSVPVRLQPERHCCSAC